MLANLRCRAPSQVARRTRSGCIWMQCRASRTEHRTSQELLSWATGRNLLYEHLPVVIQQHPEYGRCLVASEDIEPDTVVLSVCMDRVFASQVADELDMHWAAEMALRLLQERHACRHHDNSSSSSSSNSVSGSSSDTTYWQPWINSLPQSVVTPVQFTAEEVQQLVIPSALQAVLNMRICLEDCYSELQQQLEDINCGWHDFLWAVQVLHSRCFFEPTTQRHLAVPGIDMANHSSTNPNAIVRLLNSPEACQGMEAVAEVAPAVAPGVTNASYFQLLAGPEGIKGGEQVCISYGQWPAEPFLLLFGFVPQPNPYESVTVFSNLQHMAECYVVCAAEQLDKMQDPQANRVLTARKLLAEPTFHALLSQQLQCIEEQHGDVTGGGEAYSGFMDMIVNASGVDGRLGMALTILHNAIQEAVTSSVQQHGQVHSSSGLADANKGVQLNEVNGVVQALQLDLGTLLRHRLKHIRDKLQCSCRVLQHIQSDDAGQQSSATAGSSSIGASDSVRAEHRMQDQHAMLILQYCNSKLALVDELLQSYGLQYD